MEKRQPLSVMIALQGKKMRGEEDAPAKGESKDYGDEEVAGDGRYDDPGLISASEDAIDAMKNRDPKALSRAWCNFLDIHSSLGDGHEEPDEDDRN